jgi:hypothetical protein
MFPVWFFIVLMLIICSLLFIMKASEESLPLNDNHLKRFISRLKKEGSE